MRDSASIIVATLLIVAGAAASRTQETRASSGPSEPLRAYLRSYSSLGGKAPSDGTTKITAVTVRTDNGKADDVVYVSGKQWCGSGGCTLLVLEPVGSTFEVLGRVTIVQLPVRLLPSTSNGRPDIGVTVRGGGVPAGYEAVLSFDGKHYPSNPSLPPARKAIGVQGKVIIANTEGSIRLYD